MRPTMTRSLQNMLQRAEMTEQEIRTWHGVLSALIGIPQQKERRKKKGGWRMTNPMIQRVTPQPAHQEDRVRVFVRECRVDLRVGIYESEAQAPQPVHITVECEGAPPHHYHDRTENRLARVIDYEPLYKFMCEELPKQGHIYLLETAAEQIISFCFRDPRVREVLVRIEKTGVFPHAAGAGVELRRTRQA